MCAEFIVPLDLIELRKLLGNLSLEPALENRLGTRVHIRGWAPIIFEGLQGVSIRAMQFSLVPAWSKEATAPFATFNARLDNLTQKPTWKTPFLRRRGVVPISGFVEPCYQGPFAGKMVLFQPNQQRQPLLAAAIFDIWSDPATKEDLFSFAIITEEASGAVSTIGHPRQPLFLSATGITKWIDRRLNNPSRIMGVIDKYRELPELNAKADREMRPGWEKRLRRP